MCSFLMHPSKKTYELHIYHFLLIEKNLGNLKNMQKCNGAIALFLEKLQRKIGKDKQMNFPQSDFEKLCLNIFLCMHISILIVL